MDILPPSTGKRELETPATGAVENVSLAAIARGAPKESIQQTVRRAALGATDFSWLGRGETVFIKIAHNSGRRYPSTTSPDAVLAIVRLLKEKGAGRVLVGDMSGIEYLKLTPSGVRGSTRTLMAASGMADAVKEAGAELHCFEEAGWDGFYGDAPPADSHWKKPLMMPNILREADHIVLLPRCAMHIIAGATLGMKAAVGYWRTDTRLEYHHDAATLQEKTAEANFTPALAHKQRLALTLADKVLTTIGPDYGHVARPETGLAFASTSVVAHDMVSHAWLLENRLTAARSAVQGIVGDLADTPLVAAISNRVVVKWLDSFSSALGAERFRHNGIETIWDDRTLNRAFHLCGGVPQLRFAGGGAGEIETRLAEMTRLPPARRD